MTLHTVKLSDVLSFQKKSKFKAGEGISEGKYKFFTSSNIQSKFLNDYTFLGDCLIMGTGGMASIHYCKEQFAASTDCFILANKSPHKLFTKYVYYYLYGNMHILEAGFKGAGLKHISKEYVSKIEIPLPPLEVQKKIADILDTADQLRRKNKELIKKYDELAQAIFIEMFGDPVTNPKGWEIKKLNEVCYKITDGAHLTPNYVENGIPFLRVTDLTSSNDTKRYISIEEHLQLIKRCKPEKGDVLYSKNGTIGVAKVVDWNYEFSIFVSLCLLKIKKDLILPEYMANYLNTPVALNQAKKHSKTGTVTNLHLNEIKEILIPMPSIEIQKAYLNRINYIANTKKLISNNQYDQLFQSLLQRAFNGELVR